MHLGRSFRAAVAFMLAVSATTLIGVSLIYRDASYSVEQHRRAIVTAEVAAVVRDGPERVREELQFWLRQELDHWSVAGLFDASGRRLAGDLTQVPPNLALDGHVHRFDMPTELIDPRTRTEPFEEILVAGMRRPDGDVLVLGQTMAEVTDLRHAVLDVGLWGGAALLVGSMMVAMRSGFRQAARLDLFRQTLADVMGGALDERLPARGRDDLDAFACDVNVMLDRLQALVSEVKQVSDNIAHDLRTPLTVVRARLEAALIAETDLPALRDTTAVALTDLDRALAAMTALLRLAEIESGRRRAGFQPIDVAAVCRSAFEFYLPLAEDQGIQLSFVSRTGVWIMGDADLLLEAVNNLLDNALKYTEGPGTVGLSAWTEGDVIVLAVWDSGVGFPVAERERLGRRFYRADQSRHKPGTGLGLSLVAAIAELHGFGLNVGENWPRGTLFTLSGTYDERAAAVLVGGRAPTPRAPAHTVP